MDIPRMINRQFMAAMDSIKGRMAISIWKRPFPNTSLFGYFFKGAELLSKPSNNSDPELLLAFVLFLNTSLWTVVVVVLVHHPFLGPAEIYQFQSRLLWRAMNRYCLCRQINLVANFLIPSLVVVEVDHHWLFPQRVEFHLSKMLPPIWIHWPDDDAASSSLWVIIFPLHG